MTANKGMMKLTLEERIAHGGHKVLRWTVGKSVIAFIYWNRFAIPKYDNDGELAGYNVFKGRLVIRHAPNGKRYLYDVLRIKKETSEPLE